MFEAEGDDIQPRGQTSAELTGDEDGPFVLVDEAQCSAPTSPELHQESFNKNHRLDKKSSINQKRLVRTYTLGWPTTMTIIGHGLTW